MSSLETNKIFAAVLVAGIVAMLSGFVAELLTESHELEKDAVAIEGAPEAGAGAAAVAMPEPILSMIATADVAQGEKISKACAACHSFGKGEPAKVGPNLWGVVGRKKATFPGFAYSDAMVAHGGTWEYSELNHFIWSPKKFIPGTKMGFIGLKKPEDRAAIIAWLRTLNDSPHPLPSAAEIAQEAKDLAPPAAATPATEGAKPAAGAATGAAAAPAKEAAPAAAAPAKEAAKPAEKEKPKVVSAPNN